MKKTILIIATLFVTAFVGQAQDMTLEEVLESHFEAIGQEKMNDVKSMTMTGKQMAQGMEYPFKIVIKRPDKLRIEATIQGNTMVQAYNGKDGWMIMPWVSTDPQDANEEQLKGFKEQADMDGKLYNWKDKGHTVELIGTEDMEGTEVYKVKVSEKPDKEGEEGNNTFYFIDSENFVILKTTAKRIIQGNEIEVESFQSNYKQTNGVAIAFSMETKMGGNSISQIIVEEIKFDEEIDDKIFDRPEKKEEVKKKGE
ncbi:MAG: outer membrane lipoprotein-sorting protein [Bacteroidota bacterium]